jgi:hypothetical protein
MKKKRPANPNEKSDEAVLRDLADFSDNPEDVLPLEPQSCILPAGYSDRTSKSLLAKKKKSDSSASPTNTAHAKSNQLDRPLKK